MNIKDNDGNTPLHLAAMNGNTGIVQTLLEKGANTNAKNNRGKTASTLADEGAIKKRNKCYKCMV